MFVCVARVKRVTGCHEREQGLSPCRASDAPLNAKPQAITACGFAFWGRSEHDVNRMRYDRHKSHRWTARLLKAG